MALDAARLVLGISIFPLKKFIYYFSLGAASHNIATDHNMSLIAESKGWPIIKNHI
jgi:basic membrane lipoprotein Med (substrate-binding protein (PBP1-ABC) superfamily)